MTIQAQLITAGDLLRLPEDGFCHELVRGELKRMAPAGHDHGRIAMRLGWRLAQYVEANNLGAVYAAETGFLLSSSPDTVRAADVAFVSRRRIEEADRVEGYWPGAPDLVFEVVSPGDTYTELEEKVVEWLDAGARLVVVVDPRRYTATVYRGLAEITILTAQATLDGGEVVPGWVLRIADLFP